ncbi:hypothetical protein AVEN_33050-1, partial [Araneus ventricosus]
IDEDSWRGLLTIPPVGGRWELKERARMERERFARRGQTPDSNFSLQQACHKFVMTRVQVCHKFVMTRVQACSKLTKAPKSP